MTFTSIKHWPVLDRPVLVVGLEGWIDAARVGQSAVHLVASSFPHDVVAEFDAGALIDNRSRRPLLRIVNGVLDEMTWPALRILASRPHEGRRTVLVLIGPEPDFHWREWVDEVVELAKRMGVEMVVGLGAFPAPVPHTRPVQVAATATSQELASKIGFVPGALEVAGGAQAALQMSMGAAGIPSVGLWRALPHYTAGGEFPEAGAVLVDELSKLIGVPIDTTVAHEGGAFAIKEIEALIAKSPEHADMVRQLEEQYDAETVVVTTDLTYLPNGDELAAELENYLRGEAH